MSATDKNLAEWQRERAPAGVRRQRPRHRRVDRPAPGVAAIIENALAEKVMMSGGSSSGFTNLQAIVLQLMKKSAAGDKRATKVLMRYRRRDPEIKEPSITVIGGLYD